MPSVELQRKSDQAMIFGIVYIFFGWTVLIPIASLLCFFADDGASALAKKEGVPVPARATIGLILTLIFGAMQTLALIIKLNH
jgi:hypothetical protein